MPPLRYRQVIAVTACVWFLWGPRQADGQRSYVASSTNACRRGSAIACMQIAHTARSRGNLTRAKRHFRQACEGGSGRGCYELGRLLERSASRSTLRRASTYHRWACDLQVRDGCRRMRVVDRKLLALVPKLPPSPPRPVTRAGTKTRYEPDTWTREEQARRREGFAPHMSLLNIGFSGSHFGTFGTAGVFIEHVRYRHRRFAYGGRVRVGGASASDNTQMTSASALAFQLEPTFGYVIKASANRAGGQVRRWTVTVGGDGFLLNSDFDGADSANKLGGFGFLDVTRHTNYWGRRSDRARIRLRLRGGHITDIGSGFDAALGYSTRLMGIEWAVGQMGSETTFDARVYLAL